jgi:hypothetical protein
MNDKPPKPSTSPPPMTPEFPLTDEEKLLWLENIVKKTPNKKIEAGIERQIQELKNELAKDD